MDRTAAMTLHLDICKDEIQILLAEDEPETRQLLKACLQRAGYNVVAVDDGQQALQAFAASLFDIVILDIKMPVLDGWTVCAELRKQTHVPIMIVTASTRPDDVVRGIQLGADSYISKPFTLKELRARVLAVLRRAKQKEQYKASWIVRKGEIAIDKRSHEVSVRNRKISIAPTEYRLLSYLFQNPDRPISLEELVAEVWGYQTPDCNEFSIVRVSVLRLRTKIEEKSSSPKYLKTVHGYGYQFCTVSPPIASKEATEAYGSTGDLGLQTGALVQGQCAPQV